MTIMWTGSGSVRFHVYKCLSLACGLPWSTIVADPVCPYCHHRGYLLRSDG